MRGAEQRLWSLLRNRQLGGFKFRRQYAFGPYVLDFFCLREKLAIEADGGSHFTPEGQAGDRVRTVYLQDHRVRVLRFTNAQILKDSQVVPLTLTLSLRARETDRKGPARNMRRFSYMVEIDEPQSGQGFLAFSSHSKAKNSIAL